MQNIPETAFITYAKAFLKQDKPAAYVETRGFDQTLCAHLAAFILIQEGHVAEENYKDVAGVLLSFGVGANASQCRQKLVKLGLVPDTTKSSADL